MEPEKLNPIKRHEALVKFSREHHYGLLLCWKIRQGVKNKIQPERIAAYALYFFDEDLIKHFEEEEATLFPRLAEQDPLRIQAINEHQKIYSLTDRITKEVASYELVNELADMLDKHIRFEERTLFNHLQSKLSDDELTELANNHKHASCDIDAGWKDHFWK